MESPYEPSTPEFMDMDKGEINKISLMPRTYENRIPYLAND